MDNRTTSYIRNFFITTTGSILLIVFLNFFIDPAGVYHKDKSPEQEYANALAQTRNGLWWPDNSFDERAIKKHLAKEQQDQNPDCIIIGSSHVMQIGSSRPQKSLTDLCRTILNLSVSGAGLEDQLALTHLVFTKSVHAPTKLILEIAPWTFAFGRDLRWSNAYPDDYREMLNVLETPESADLTEGQHSKATNLISLQYTKESLKELYRMAFAEYKKEIQQAPPLQEDFGGKYPALFPDGSLLYSAYYYRSTNQTKVKPGGDNYKTGGTDPKAISLYVRFLKWVIQQGHEPILIMTPYHPKVLTYSDSANSKAIRETESVVAAIKADLNLAIIGSFNPNYTKCDESEFLDFMHARVSCLNKLSIR
jgi:hypothetical protein